MNSYVLFSLVLNTAVSGLLTFLIWRRDVYFAIFFSMLVLYSVVAQWGYFLVPELSEVILRMYFGEAAIAPAAFFTSLSLLALFASYRFVYKPLTRKQTFRLKKARDQSGIFLILYAASLIAFLLVYLPLRAELNYGNASDEDFLESAGLLYRIFWQFYKFSVFGLLVAYALARQRIFRDSARQRALLLMLAIHGAIFIAATITVGSRTDPLALVLGIVGFEVYSRKLATQSTRGIAFAKRRLPIGKILIGCALALYLLTLLESYRSGGSTTRDDVSASAVAQAALLKDYYTPFHVLVGAMEQNYVAPLTAISSNLANSLMFLGVDYLQYFVVEQWAPGSVSRSSSPALFAFTEGFVTLGWLGFSYNGVVWAAGIALWRKLSRTNNDHFNALAFCITLALAATMARSQSSYFIKDIYLWFLPALLLYALAAGLTPAARRRTVGTAPPPRLVGSSERTE